MLTVAKFERMRRDISVKAVSEQTGIDAARYRNFERGDRSRYLTNDELLGVSACIGVPRAMIADDRGAPLMMA